MKAEQSSVSTKDTAAALPPPTVPALLPPCTYSVLLLSVTKGRGHWPCKSFHTTTSVYLKSSWPFSCCAQMLFLIHSALVKQRRSWITILFVFHFKYLFSRPQSSVKHLYSRSGGKCGKVSDRAGPAWHWQSQPLFEFWVLGLPSLLVYLPSFSSVSLHFLLPLLAFSFNRLQS